MKLISYLLKDFPHEGQGRERNLDMPGIHKNKNTGMKSQEFSIKKCWIVHVYGGVSWNRMRGAVQVKLDLTALTSSAIDSCFFTSRSQMRRGGL